MPAITRCLILLAEIGILLISEWLLWSWFHALDAKESEDMNTQQHKKTLETCQLPYRGWTNASRTA